MLAEHQGSALAKKPDSQEICFIPGGDYKQFLDAYLAELEKPCRTPAATRHHDGTSRSDITTASIISLSVSARAWQSLTGSPLYVIGINGAEQKSSGRQQRGARDENPEGQPPQLDFHSALKVPCGCR